MDTAPLQDSYVRMSEPASFVEGSVRDLLREAAARHPDRLALIVPAGADGREARQWTYRELEAAAERAAGALLARFAPGDRVATWAAGSAAVVQLHLGAALAGLVLVTLNPANQAVELEYLLRQSQARGLFLDCAYRGMDHAGVIERLRPSLPALEHTVLIDGWMSFLECERPAAWPTVSPDDPAMILFTSGTTGQPKGAVLRHSGICNNARLTTARLGLGEGAVWLNVLPMFHVGGSVTMTLGCLSNFGTQILLPEFGADAALGALERYGVQVTMAVPTMLVALMQSPRLAGADLSKLEVIVTGGTVIAPELVRSTKARFGAEVMVLFGQTEAGGAMCLTRRGDDVERVTQSVGAPLALSEAKVVAPDTGAVVPVGIVGEICVRTRCAMHEYFQMPEKTREALDADGWVHTGDLGTMRPDGYLQVTGRLKDMIIRGGENVYPREIEDALAAHPAVSQAAVFGVPDAAWGESVAAAVVLKPGAAVQGEGLAEYLKARIARHKVPKAWHFVDALPVNASGKIQKFVLRKRFAPTGA